MLITGQREKVRITLLVYLNGKTNVVAVLPEDPQSIGVIDKEIGYIVCGQIGNELLLKLFLILKRIINAIVTLYQEDISPAIFIEKSYPVKHIERLGDRCFQVNLI